MTLVNHVGIYVGNDQFIHASDETENVTIDSINSMYKEGDPYYAKWDPDRELLIKSEKRLYFPIWVNLEGIIVMTFNNSQYDSTMKNQKPFLFFSSR